MAPVIIALCILLIIVIIYSLGVWMLVIGSGIIAIAALNIVDCANGIVTGSREKKFNEIDIAKNKEYFAELDSNGLLTEMTTAPMTSALTRFDEIDHKLPYKQFDDLARTTIHIGQFKLFLSELQFLTMFADSRDEQIVLVYSGSSPSHKASYLGQMFPRLKIVMIDPAEHEIYYPNGGSQYDDAHIDETVYFKCATGDRYGHGDKRFVNVFNGKDVSARVSRGDAVVAKAGNAITAALTDGETADWIEFIKSSPYKYFILEDLFNNDAARMFAQLGGTGVKFLYASDIRTTMDEKFRHPGDLDILWNSAMQFNWTQIMQPHAIMLKFRTPYFEKREFNRVVKNATEGSFADVFAMSFTHGVDFIGDYKKREFRYFSPDCINIQAYPGQSSTESRLIVSAAANPGYTGLTAYDHVDYEQRFFYYNRIRRCYGFHNVAAAIFDEKTGFDGCGDCALAYSIFRAYYDKYDAGVDGAKDSLIKTDIDTVMDIIRRKFIEPGGNIHGHFFKKYDSVEEIVDEQKKYIEQDV